MAEDTRERILDAAEQLFAVHGFDGTSVRDVTTQAGVNLAAVHYHFGSKEELLRAVLARIIAPANRERLEMLEAAEREPGGPTVEALLRAFVLPELQMVSQLGPRGPVVVRLISRLFHDPNPAAHQIAMDGMSEVGGKFIQLLAIALPGLPFQDVALRMQCVVGVMTFFLGDIAPPQWRIIDLAQPEEAFERVASVLVPALNAPPSGAWPAPDALAGIHNEGAWGGH